MSGGKGSRSQTVTQEVDVPDFLQPLMRQSAGVGQRSLRNLEALSGGDLVAGFSPTQEMAQNLGAFRALGGDGFLPAAQQQAMATVGGMGLDDFLDPAALQSLRTTATGGGALSGLTGGFSPPQVSRDALEATARGDFLDGGFDDQFQAAMNRAAPQIMSQFGAGGRGAATGGLAQTAMNQAAADSFSQLFDRERQRQLGAAGDLASLDLSGRQQQLGALGLQAQTAGNLAGLSAGERGRQLQATGFLPNLAMSDVDILSRIGGQQQQQAQRELSAPMQAQQGLLASALGAPSGFAPLFGSTQQQPMQSNLFGNILGGASVFGSLFGDDDGPSLWGGLGGAALGGLFG